MCLTFHNATIGPNLTTCFIVLPQDLQDRIDRLGPAREQITQSRVLNVDFFPRESHLITFRDPWSFPILFHPACSHLIKKHMIDLAQKVWDFLKIALIVASRRLIGFYQDSVRLRLPRRISYYKILPASQPAS